MSTPKYGFYNIKSTKNEMLVG